MIPEETQKKLYIIGLVSAVVLGVIFMIYAIFLNRGEITVDALPPFNIEIGGFKTESCLKTPCSIVVAPGEYSVNLTKSGYQNYEFTAKVPINGKYSEQAVFEYIAIAEADDSLNPDEIFAEPSYESDQPDGTQIFGEPNFITYLKINPDTKRQTLYYRSIAEGVMGEETIATSFIRTMSESKIIPFIEKQKIIFIIDYSDTGSAIYLINLDKKSRTKIAEHPYTEDIKWIDGTDKYIFDVRNGNGSLSTIYIYDTATESERPLNLQTTISNTAVLDSNTLIASTAGQELEFWKYDLTNNESKLITSYPSASQSEKIKLNEFKDIIYALTGGTVIKIKFRSI